MPTPPFQLLVTTNAGTADWFAAWEGAAGTAVYVRPDSIEMTAEADGNSQTLTFTAEQEVTPGGTPWFQSIPDNAIVRFVDVPAGTATLFSGYIAEIQAQLNGGGQGSIAEITCNSATELLDRIAVYKGKGTVGGIKGAVTNTIKYAKGKTDQYVIKHLLTNYVNTRLGDQISLLFDPTSQGSIANTATLNNQADDSEIIINIGSLKSALETVMQLATATDGKLRRYYIDPRNKRLVYGFLSATDQGQVYPNAPFVLTTDAVEAPAGGATTVSTLNPRDLRVGYDHGQIAKRVFLLCENAVADADNNTEPYLRTYNQAGIGFPVRTGSMGLDDFVEAPNVRGTKKTQKLTTAAKAFFTERYQPVTTIECSVRGAGTATNQTYGFAQGVYQNAVASAGTVSRAGSTATFNTVAAHGLTIGQAITVDLSSGPAGYTDLNGTFTVAGTATTTRFTYVTPTTGTITAGLGVGYVSTYGTATAWEPGQFMRLTSSGLGLSGMYRIEQVTMGFEDNSFIRKYDLTLERRRRGALSQQVGRLNTKKA
jgi:hypothetical protein